MIDDDTRIEALEEINEAERKLDRLRYGRPVDDDHRERIEAQIEIEERHIRRLLELT